MTVNALSSEDGESVIKVFFDEPTICDKDKIRVCMSCFADTSSAGIEAIFDKENFKKLVKDNAGR
jgi:hypothetical protein